MLTKCKYPIVLLLASLIFGNTLAQETAGEFVLLDPLTNPGQILDEIKLPPPSVEGTHYMNDEWNRGNVYFSTNYQVNDLLLKYDLEHNLLEIRTATDIKVATPDKVQKFEWFNGITAGYTLFVNCKQFKFHDDTPYIGFFEVIVDDNIKLLSKTDLKVLAPNYAPTVDMGRKNDKIVHKEKYYVTLNNIVYPLPSNKNKCFTMFKGKETEMEKYAKKNKLKCNNREDLVQIVEYYNSIH